MSYPVYVIILVVFAVTIILSIVMTSRKGNLKEINISKESVIVHFTTTSKRINTFCQDAVDSYINNPLVDQIIISVPKTSLRYEEAYPEITWYSEKDPKYNKLYINFVDKDYGPATKFIGLLDMPDEFKQKHKLGSKEIKNTYFFICDDDVIYHDWLIEKMLVTSRGNARADLFSNARNGQFATFIRGYTGVLIRPSFFKKELKYIEMPESCFKIDDQWIQMFIETFQIRVTSTNILMPATSNDKILKKQQGMDGDGLYMDGDRNAQIRQCGADLTKFYNNVPTLL